MPHPIEEFRNSTLIDNFWRIWDFSYIYIYIFNPSKETDPKFPTWWVLLCKFCYKNRPKLICVTLWKGKSRLCFLLSQRKISFFKWRVLLHQTNNEKNGNTFSHPLGKMKTTPWCMDFYGSSEAMVRKLRTW